MSSLTPIEIQKRENLRRTKPLVYDKVIKYEEKFRRGESIAIIQFQYDYRCNFNCVHCCTANMHKKPRYFSLNDVRELSRQADAIGLAHFTITGGEPLIFPDLEQLVEALNPDKFYIAMDSNAWLLDDAKAKWLKSIGIEKVHLSLDSMYVKEHDDFRKRKGSFDRVLKAIDASRNAGLAILINTVVTRQRARSDEFRRFLEYTNSMDARVVMMLAKPAGRWQGNLDVILDQSDLEYVRRFETTHNAFTHLVPAYGMDMGCIAVKRMVSITRYGDLMPCPWIHISLGNVFEEPLKDILERGMSIKWFGQKQNTCLGSVDGEFMRDYLGKIFGKPFPVPWQEVFTEKDFIRR